MNSDMAIDAVEGWRFDAVGLGRPEEWAAVLAPLQHVYTHTWAYAWALSQRREALDCGLPMLLWRARHAGQPWECACVMAVDAWKGARHAFTPGGISGWACSASAMAAGPAFWPELLAAWDRLAQQQGWVASYWAQHPWTVPAAEGVDICRSRQTLFFLNVEGGGSGVLARANKDRRREWRRWQEAGHRVEEAGLPLLRFTADKQGRYVQQRGATWQAVWPEAVLRQWMSEPAVAAWGVRDAHSGQLAAACWVGVVGEHAEGLVLMADPDDAGARKHYAGLMVLLAERLSAQGVRWLHLGGGYRPGDALEQAKRQWHPDEAAMLRLGQVHAPARYADLCQQAGVDPQAAGFFPAYLSAC